MGFYGLFTYGSAFYGLGGLPTSIPWDLYDFCEPSDATMLTLFAYAEVTPARVFGAPHLQFDVNNDLVMMSNDSADSGFRIDISIPQQFTIQFSLMPKQLPPDFSDTSKRVFVGSYNASGKMLGVLLSEAGIALAETGTSAYSLLADSADLFDESASYWYTFRFTADPATGRGNIYVTRQDLLPVIGHQLRYTYNLYDTPGGLTDHTLFEVYGTSGDNTEIALDCWRLSSTIEIPNQRPIAIPGPDQTVILGGFGGFDGRSSYDPEGVSPLQYWWTAKSVPEGSTSIVRGLASTPVDASGFTNIANGAVGVFSDLAIGDLLYVGGSGSVIQYINDDASQAVAISSVFPENTTGLTWLAVKQLGWGGAYTSGVMTYVEEARNTPPGAPTSGDTYLVTFVATGAWVAQEDRIATWNGTAWVFASPSEDDVVYVKADYGCQRYVGDSYALGQWVVLDCKPWELAYWSGRAVEIGSYLPDGGGLHAIDLLVNDGVLDSLPTEVLLNVNATQLAFGVIPDAGWIWNYLGDFWDLLEDRDKVTTTWSAFIQIASGLMLELWQHDYAKAVLDIQRIFQRKWLAYNPRYSEPDYDELPAAIDNSVDLGGYSPEPGSDSYTYRLGTTVIDSLTTPPVNPVAGDAYLVTSVAAGAWAGREDDVATWDGTTWAYRTPADYAVVYDAAASAYLRYTSSSWGAYTFDITTILEGHILILDGVGYYIARATKTSIITSDALPSSRSVGWLVKPVVTSRASNFDTERVQAGDLATFETVDSNGDTADITAYIYGARRSKLCFDDGDVSAAIANPDLEVRFKSVLRRSKLRLINTIVGIPRLQEIINLDGVEDAPNPLNQALNYLVAEDTVFDQQTINTLTFVNAWFDEVVNGFDGDTTAGPQYVDSAGSDFVTDLGEVGTDLSGYVIELPSGTYRLYQVVSATRIELGEEALDSASGLNWTIRRATDPPEQLWADTTYIDNRQTIEANFGRLVGFKVEDLESRTDGLDYLSAVQGLWYTYWFGPTPHNLRVGSQILLGLPFAEKAGTITDVQSPFDVTRSRILIQDADNDSITRSYFFPTSLGVETNPETDAAYTVGDTIEQFAPISQGVDVTDWVIDDDWFSTYFGSEDFFELWKMHTFGVIVDSDAFDLTNLEFVMSYILRIKPSYTYPWFVVALNISDVVDIDDAFAIGPVTPRDNAGTAIGYPDDWPAMPTPPGWADSPWEMARVVTPTYDITTRWPNDRYVGPGSHNEFGNLHLHDTLGRVPDGWDGNFDEDGTPHAPTRSEGAHIIGDTDESGHVIHLIGQHTLASDLSTDGDMELGGVADYPAVGSPGTRVKSGVRFVSGSQSLQLADGGAGVGAYQDFPSAIDRGFQVGIRCKVWVVSGQAKFRLRDQDGTAYVAEARFSARNEWQDVVLHVWSVADDSNAVRFEMVTGVAGGEFFVDDVEIYTKLMPWDQWGIGRMISGRTGGYTEGGSPDEYLTFQITAEVP